MAFTTAPITMQTLLARYWLWALIGATALVVLFGVSFFILPEYARWGEQGGDMLAAREVEIQRVGQETRQLRAALETYTRLNQVQVQRVLQLLPSTVAFPDLLFLIARVAEQAGFSITSFSVQASDAPKKSGIQEKQSSLIQVSLSGKGYRQWKRFLDLMERQLPLMDLVSTDFRPQNTHQQFSFRTYILP